MKKLAILILNWNNKVLTDICINSVKSQSYKDYKIFVIDNNSSDGSVSYLKRKHRDIYIIKNKSNLGYAAGNNIGIKEALRRGFEYIFIINNDIELFTNCLEILVNILNKDPKIGVVTPIALNYYEEKKDTKIGTYYGDYNFLFGEFKTKSIDKNEAVDVNLIVGCSLMVKREVFEKCGLFDERYYMYWEDFDLLTRIKKYDYKIFIHPLAKIYHRVGSTSRHPEFPRSYYNLRNTLLYHKENSNSFIFIFYILYFLFKLPFFLFRKKNLRDLRLNLFAIIDFINNNYYKTNITKKHTRFLY